MKSQNYLHNHLHKILKNNKDPQKLLKFDSPISNLKDNIYITF